VFIALDSHYFVFLLLHLFFFALALEIHPVRTLIRLDIYKATFLVPDCIEFCSS